MRLLQPTSSDRVYNVVSPDVAAADSVQEDVVRIQELNQTIQDVRSQLAAVEPRYTAARRRRLQTFTPVELIEDPAAVRRLIRNSTSECTQWAYILHPSRSLRAESHRASAVFDKAMVQRGIERRNLYHEGVLSSAATRRSAAELIPLGVKFRITPWVPLVAMIYDEDLAILSRRSSPEDRAAIVIRDADLVGIVLLLYRTLWDTAAPFPLDDQEQLSSPGELSEKHRKVLSGLASGLTDEAIARRLGIHVRMLRRQISELSDQTNSESRFQLAVHATDQGWI